MKDERPDPDTLLARVQAEEAQSRRGRLKIFFGASAGVGKTYAMLNAARLARQQGLDVLVGVVETHGRAETEALLDGLERQPLRTVAYKGRNLQEFDLDGVLQRRPRLVLVDELAHSNVAGSRHPKRWQDVQELLDAGIDVWTTLNVQHLETLNDVVTGITGIRVWETVPDSVFDDADEVVIVDLPPDDLLQRLKDGKVYLPQQATTAVRNFFRKGNLIALRELALRRTADRVDDDMNGWRRDQSVEPVWATRGALLLAIGPDERSEVLVRGTARLAAQLDVPWHCIHVESPRARSTSEHARLRVLQLLKLAQDTGAQQTELLSAESLPEAIVRYAHTHNLSRVVLGRDTRRSPPWWRDTLAEAVGQRGADLDVMQIALPAQAVRSAAVKPQASADERALAWQPYAGSVAVCAVAAVVAAPLNRFFELSNIVMLFLLAVVVVAVRWGRGPAVLAAFLAVGLFDFLYVPPRFSFSVSDVQYLWTFVVMLVVALVIGQLTATLKWQARLAHQREARVRALYDMSRELGAALLPEQVAALTARFVSTQFEASAALWVANAQDRLDTPVPTPGLAPGLGIEPGLLDLSIARWAFEHGEAAGQGTNTLPAAPVLYLPLKAPMRMRGVLALQARQPARLSGPDQRRLLETCASLVAISLERIHYVEVAQSTTVQMESERLRNSLLAAISHDLRTPLAALIGMAETMAASPQEPDRLRELSQAIRDSAQRMGSQVNNLLDMARLQAGAVTLHRQWLPLEEAVGSALRATAAVLPPERVRLQWPDDLPMLYVDPVLFERVLCNLFENVAKYTPAGSPVTLRALVADDRLLVQLDDAGPGLPRQREAQMFEMFERGRKESAIPGVGLGLAICRAIVQAHGGRIEARNLAGGGARFEMSLPLHRPPAVLADLPGVPHD